MSSRSALAPGTGSVTEIRRLRALALCAVIFLLGACARQPAPTPTAPPRALPSVTAAAAAAGFLLSGADWPGLTEITLGLEPTAASSGATPIALG